MRKTPQTILIYTILQKMNHATTPELHEAAILEMPSLTINSIHRIVSRLFDQGEIIYGPPKKHMLTYDANPIPHSHFYCEVCQSSRDIIISETTILSIQRQIGKDNIGNRVAVAGICKACQDAVN